MKPPPKGLKVSARSALPFKTGNKQKRQELFVNQKRVKEASQRDERFKRKREEKKDPESKEKRLKTNIPQTLERKRVWDEYTEDLNGGLGQSVSVEEIERRKRDAEVADDTNEFLENDAEEDDDHDSMLDSDEDEIDGDGTMKTPDLRDIKRSIREQSMDTKSMDTTASTAAGTTASTNLNLTPEALVAKFPTLFDTDQAKIPKVLITTSINSTLHAEANILTNLFPHSVYIPRSAHRYGHKFSVREIASFATNRNYTSLVVMKEDQKVPTGLSIVHLPAGPTFHFSISNWVEGRKLPGHGNPTNHSPELILNGFRTPLGLLSAHLFRTLFPPQPELQGRQVVTLHNQRDYIFVRRHRYVFREKRTTEKSVVGADGKEVKGAEGIRAGLQELGPRFTLKLRRVDKGIGRAGGDVEWEWKGGMEKVRTRFNL
jgi:ribosome production factor 1